ncbi:hypothetical protein F5Y09DRAFT_345855 [Xylaria sp. FL1042]|nr:hypothetical protein F5Y09DRAFT_345855 [Xylaria sp. FL1042]
MKHLNLVASLLGLAAASSAVNAVNKNLQARQDPDDLLIFELSALALAKACSMTNPTRPRSKGYASGFQCDEYPFASSVPTGGSNTRLNRCVPAAQNRKQGGIISAYYQSSYCKGNNGGKCNYSVEFSNAGNIMYCDMQDCDADDDNEVVGPGGTANDGDSAEDGSDGDPDASEKKEKAKRRGGLGKRLPGAPVYRTSSGLELDLPRGAQIGQRAFVVLPRNVTLWNEQAQFGNPNGPLALHGDESEEDENYDYMLANLEMREDVIVEEVTPRV